MDADLTLAEAAHLTQTVLTPPLTEAQLRHLIRALRWQPAGWRHNGHGHPYATYPWNDICQLHKALLPFIR